MNSLADDCGLLLAVLRSHPQRAMTSTRVAAKVRQLDAQQITRVVAALRDGGAIVVREARLGDPHFPAVLVLAAIDEPADGPGALADAHRRAQKCVEVLQRQMLRAHRCT